ncbi:hypothetical protein MTR67_047584 [Solanum verrucosum]|uniref:Uncharacterized protein n=1 Tax=Solanum verrucosum TaxID=315347 RepID=A0AAF0ZZ63_SOLVR|nr:hypothetical protein MTR67_047584 [Solanum verrucosum]
MWYQIPKSNSLESERQEVSRKHFTLYWKSFLPKLS